MNIEWIHALMGGVLIGTSVTILLLFNGRVTGISGILSGALFPHKGEVGWRMAFLSGLLSGGLLLYVLRPEFFSKPVTSSTLQLIIAGVLVGFGTLLGNGCTSGHGVCGISRLSIRSIVATISFIFAGILMVSAIRYLGWLS